MAGFGVFLNACMYTLDPYHGDENSTYVFRVLLSIFNAVIACVFRRFAIFLCAFSLADYFSFGTALRALMPPSVSVRRLYFFCISSRNKFPGPLPRHSVALPRQEVTCFE